MLRRCCCCCVPLLLLLLPLLFSAVGGKVQPTDQHKCNELVEKVKTDGLFSLTFDDSMHLFLCDLSHGKVKEVVAAFQEQLSTAAPKLRHRPSFYQLTKDGRRGDINVLGINSQVNFSKQELKDAFLHFLDEMDKSEEIFCEFAVSGATSENGDLDTDLQAYRKNMRPQPPLHSLSSSCDMLSYVVPSMKYSHRCKSSPWFGGLTSSVIELYKAGDHQAALALDALMCLVPPTGSSTKSAIQRKLHASEKEAKRNEEWIAKLSEFSGERRAVFVGYVHLFGEDGLLRKLQDADGWSIKQRPTSNADLGAEVSCGEHLHKKLKEAVDLMMERISHSLEKKKSSGFSAMFSAFQSRSSTSTVPSQQTNAAGKSREAKENASTSSVG